MQSKPQQDSSHTLLLHLTGSVSNATAPAAAGIAAGSVANISNGPSGGPSATGSWDLLIERLTNLMRLSDPVVKAVDKIVQVSPAGPDPIGGNMRLTIFVHEDKPMGQAGLGRHHLCIYSM